MDNQPVSYLTFPCDFPIKIIGYATEEFEINALSIIRLHQPDLPENALRSRPSHDGKYLSLTVIVHVENKLQLDTIYQNLSDNPYIIMTL